MASTSPYNNLHQSGTIAHALAQTGPYRVRTESDPGMGYDSCMLWRVSRFSFAFLALEFVLRTAAVVAALTYFSPETVRGTVLVAAGAIIAMSIVIRICKIGPTRFSVTFHRFDGEHHLTVVEWSGRREELETVISRFRSATDFPVKMQ